MSARHWLCVIACLSGLQQAPAAESYPQELPPIERVRIAVDESPEVRAAIALTEAGAAERRQLIAGPHEWSSRLDYQRRRADETPGVTRFNEWELALERPLRGSQKARLDRLLGDQRVTEATVALAQARHEASRRLLMLWYQWLRERASADVLRGQAELSARELGAIARRRDLGDASALDAMQAQAADARAEALARQAAERARRAEIVLREQFPRIEPLASPVLPPPELPAESPRTLAEVAVLQDHGVRVAQAAAERGRLEGQRALAERRPDPTVGIRYATERGASERIFGVYVSIPFGGEARRATADASLAKADALEKLAEARRRQLGGELRSLESAVSSDVLRWQSAEKSARLQADVAQRVAVANQLGESPVADVLIARRNALEAALSATIAQVDALENRALLLLGAHRLWDFDSDID